MREHWRKRNETWNEIIGQQIMIRREECGLTQEQLAILVKLSDKGTISGYESGKRAPSAHTLFRISKALNCSMDFFYGPIRRENLVQF